MFNCSVVVIVDDDDEGLCDGKTEGISVSIDNVGDDAMGDIEGVLVVVTVTVGECVGDRV